VNTPHEQPCNTAIENKTEISNIKPWVCKLESSQGDLEKRIRAVEGRLAAIAGAAAATGGVIGGLIGKNVDKIAGAFEAIKNLFA
jgi:hypothetical protein